MNDQWHAYSPHAQTEIFICVFFISSASSTLYFIATWLLHIPCELLQLISQSQTIMLCKLLGKKRSYWIDYCTAAFVVHVHIQGIVQQSSDGNSGWFLQWKSTMQLAIACACTTPCMGGRDTGSPHVAIATSPEKWVDFEHSLRTSPAVLSMWPCENIFHIQG